MFSNKYSFSRSGSWLLTLVLSLLFSLPPTLLLAAAGDLDPTFGTGGKVVIDFG